MPWILHISDLHRSPDSPISNGILVESIKKEIAVVREDDSPVDMLIVSGDLVQGSREATPAAAARDLGKQYAETRDLLSILVERVADNDWDRLVVVPGNHDVCWAHSMAAMRVSPLPSNDPERSKSVESLLQRKARGELIRWSWKDLQFHEVYDKDKYRARFSDYATFVADLPGSRGDWHNQDGKRYTIQVFDKHRICVVGFSSCSNVDHLNHAGRIHPEAITGAEQEIGALGLQDYLRVAVWHHNTSGGPHDFDYMHDHVLEMLTQFGYAVAFHGHQHKSEVAYRHSEVDAEKTIAVFSAASLCAGSTAMPTGHSRGFNIVHLELETASVWAREMLAISEYPVWKNRSDGRGDGTRRVQLRPIDGEVDCRWLQKRVTALMDAEDYRTVISSVELNQALKVPTLRGAWLDSVVRLGDDERLSTFVPQSSAEAILVLGALERVGNHGRTRKRLGESWAEDTDASVVDLVRRISKRLDAIGGANGQL